MYVGIWWKKIVADDMSPIYPRLIMEIVDGETIGANNEFDLLN